MLRCSCWSSLQQRGLGGIVIQHRAARAVRTSRVVRSFAGALVIVAGTVSLAALPSAAGSASAAGIVPPSNPTADVPPQVVPACTATPVGRLDRRLHRLGPAQHQLRPLARGPRTARPAERLRQRPRPDAAADPHRRGARRPGPAGVLGARRVTQHRRAARRHDRRRPVPAASATSTRRPCRSSPQDYTPHRRRLRLDVQRRVRRHQRRLHDVHLAELLGPPRQHPRAVGDSTSSTTPMMGAGATVAGGTPRSSPTRTTPADRWSPPSTRARCRRRRRRNAPDVVQVLPASSPTPRRGRRSPSRATTSRRRRSLPWTSAGSPPPTCTSTGTASSRRTRPPTPPGRRRTRWSSPSAPAAGSSSSTGTAQVNEFTYAPSGAPSISSISTDFGSRDRLGQRHDPRQQLHRRRRGADRRLRHDASIGSMSSTSNTITTTIPHAVTPGTVNVTVTTPAGIELGLGGRPLHLHGERTPASPRPSRAGTPRRSTLARQHVQRHDDRRRRR